MQYRTRVEVLERELHTVHAAEKAAEVSAVDVGETQEAGVDSWFALGLNLAEDLDNSTVNPFGEL